MKLSGGSARSLEARAHASFYTAREVDYALLIERPARIRG
jgi:hypothetical protein